MPTGRQILLSVYWFSINMMLAAVLLVIMPDYIQAMVGDAAKGRSVGIVLGVGAAVSMVFAPVFGALSDRVRLPGGRRKPWIVLGTLGVVITLAWLAGLTRADDPATLPGWVSAFILFEFFYTIAIVPYSTLLRDQVPARQRGSAAGWMGLMIMLGFVAGGATGFLVASPGVTWVYAALIVVLLLGLGVTVFGVDEAGIAPGTPRFTIGEFLAGLYTPFRHADFGWAFFNRLMIGMGVSTVQEFILYYMSNAFGARFTLPFLGNVATAPEGATTIFFLAVFLGGTAVTLLAGKLSDGVGRKSIAYTATLVLGVSSMLFTFSHSFALSVALGAVFGLGYGAYESVNWALAADVLPSANDHGKDMGIWHVTLVLCQVIATPIAGSLLDTFQAVGAAQKIPHMGYTIIFVIAVVYFILGSICLRQIKGVR